MHAAADRAPTVNAVPEQRLARLWHDRELPAALYTTEGQSLHVVYPGTWTRADGPDFRGALLELGGRLLRGDVEIHVQASGWNQHRHRNDPAYSDVALHVVLYDDLAAPVTNATGMPIPTLMLAAFIDLATLDSTPAFDLPPSLGHSTCLPTLAGGQEAAVRNILRDAGWQRLNARAARFRQQLETLPPAEVLYLGLLDALGYMANREPMQALGERVPLAVLQRLATQPQRVAALLLHAANLLPADEREARALGLTPPAFAAVRTGHALNMQGAETPAIEQMQRSAWALRGRPANHPGRRLLALASLLAHDSATHHDLLSIVLAAENTGWEGWLQWLDAAQPAIGVGRARQIMGNVFAPFCVAYLDAQGVEPEAGEWAHAIWDALPGAADDQIARTTLRQIVGDQRLPIRTLLENQGLHHIGRSGCRELRCFECPIAALAVAHEPAHRLLREEPPGAADVS